MKAGRSAVRKQLQYLKRDLKYIKCLLGYAEHDKISPDVWCQLHVIEELYNRQHEMWNNHLQRCDNRIVSINQPHVRPIVRGKAGTPVEFGAKISVSLIDGFCFIDRLSWDNYNESAELKTQIELYKKRYGCYPESVHADKIYLTRDNRNLCRDTYHCRLSGKPLGRPKKETDKNRKELLREKKIRNQDYVDRIAIEGRFGVGKRRYGMDRIKAKLAVTSECEIQITAIVMNLDKMAEDEISAIKETYKIRRKKVA